MKQMRIGGVVTALGTPLDEQERLHADGMRRQIAMQIEAGADALIVLGSMGAMQLLTDETFAEALEVTVEAVRGRVPVVVGCGDTSTTRTLARIRRAEARPVSGVAIVPPFFFRFTRDELRAYFTQLADATTLPVYLYGNPALTKHSLDAELIAELAAIENIVGLKESGDLLTLRRTIARVGRDGGFTVLSGLTPFFDLSLQAGAGGIVDGLFAVAPELGVELLRAFRRGDADAMGGAQARIDRLADIVRVDSTFGGFTAAMNLRGIPGNFAPRPFAPITRDGRERVRGILEEIDVLGRPPQPWTPPDRPDSGS